jgi:hypothetical protein
MMTMTNPITPPNELAQQWYRDAENQLAPYYVFVARCAAQWGADQELEACCEWVDWKWSGIKSRELRAARRPKPPSLKEQAQVELDRLIALIPSEGALAMAEPIRRALEALPND